jgi:hypothetical protein
MLLITGPAVGEPPGTGKGKGLFLRLCQRLAGISMDTPEGLEKVDRGIHLDATSVEWGDNL